MRARCPKCGATADVVPTGRNSWRMELSDSFSINCVVLNERIKAEGTTTDMSCDHVALACQAVFKKLMGR